MARRYDDDDDYDDDFDDDYEDEPERPPMSKAEARSLLVGPATALQTLAVYAIITQGLALLSLIALVVVVLTASIDRPGGRGRNEAIVILVVLIIVMIGLILHQGAIAFFASSMKHASSYGASLACVLLAMLSVYLVILYLHYLTFAIMGLIFLMNGRVKSSFRSQE